MVGNNGEEDLDLQVDQVVLPVFQEPVSTGIIIDATHDCCTMFLSRYI